MTEIISYDVYDNGQGENIIRRRPWRHQTTDVEALRQRMEQRLTRWLRDPGGKRYKHITICFNRRGREDK